MGTSCRGTTLQQAELGPVKIPVSGGRRGPADQVLGPFEDTGTSRRGHQEDLFLERITDRLPRGIKDLLLESAMEGLTRRIEGRLLMIIMEGLPRRIEDLLRSRIMEGFSQEERHTAMGDQLGDRLAIHQAED